jgi:hypothetical protein
VASPVITPTPARLQKIGSSSARVLVPDGPRLVRSAGGEIGHGHRRGPLPASKVPTSSASLPQPPSMVSPAHPRRQDDHLRRPAVGDSARRQLSARHEIHSRCAQSRHK